MSQKAEHLDPMGKDCVKVIPLSIHSPPCSSPTPSVPRRLGHWAIGGGALCCLELNQSEAPEGDGRAGGERVQIMYSQLPPCWQWLQCWFPQEGHTLGGSSYGHSSCRIPGPLLPLEPSGSGLYQLPATPTQGTLLPARGFLNLARSV